MSKNFLNQESLTRAISDYKFDGKSVPLREALEAERDFAFVIICDPEHLGVYWPESTSQAILLERSRPG